MEEKPQKAGRISEEELVIAENRKNNLLFLIGLYGSVAKLNTALGRRRKDTTFAQIKNYVPNKSKGPPRRMGMAIAREIEDKLNFSYGWMDASHPELPIVDEEDSENSENFDETQTSAENASSRTEGPQTLSEAISCGGQFTKELFEEQTEIGRAASYERSLLLKHRQVDSKINKSDIEPVFVKDASLQSKLPFGSILLVNRSVRSFTGDGFYLVRHNGIVAIRHIIGCVAGGYNIVRDNAPVEHADSLANLQILGRGTGGWACSYL